MTDWRERSLVDLLTQAGLEYAIERDFPTDGWSGATFTRLERHDGRRFVLKRTSLDRDWIARATDDTRLREAWLAGRGQEALGSISGAAHVATAYVGAAADGDGVAAILMPDLSEELIAWERPGHDPAVDVATLQRVIEAVARIHSLPWAQSLDGIAPTAAGGDDGTPPPWCPLPQRLTLLSRPQASVYVRDGNPVGERFLAGWDAFDRQAPAAAAALVADLAADVGPLVVALATLPSVGLHGDLKLANVALQGPLDVVFIDWQMTLRAPAAVELGWFLVSNSGSLPIAPEPILAAYHAAIAWDAGRWGFGDAPHDLEHLIGDWDCQMDLAMLVGLLLRGWRKGLDAEAGFVLPSGISAADDLAWWCDQAVEAADRRL